MQTTLAERIIAFNKSLNYKGELPEGVSIMNPFKESAKALAASSEFYKKYYSDNSQRKFIIGINPGRFGGGITGVPFTDPKRLLDKCGIKADFEKKHEPSSEFIYKMIEAYGGVKSFYLKFYINSVSPLGFTATNDKGKEVNYNYYDRKDLLTDIMPFAVSSLKKQIALGLNTDTCYCLGTGKNFEILTKINFEHRFFEIIIPLEHPRFIKQYKAKQEDAYIEKYINAFNEK
ncbi:MAG TPA: uracil-DNA glycosylase family protein [Flavipsychrobacter sp.]|nr:uracil-DNA glycosylase family protein [Flavipsychrobacter sp.]